MQTKLATTCLQYRNLYSHLFPPDGYCEEAGFLYCKLDIHESERVLTVQEMDLLAPTAFSTRSPYYLELSSESRSQVMKRARHLDAVLAEVHSHPHQQRAEFSPRDVSGFDPFLRYVRWRLPGKPYAALVHGGVTFDALVWEPEGTIPGPLQTLLVDDTYYTPTGLTLENWNY